MKKVLPTKNFYCLPAVEGQKGTFKNALMAPEVHT